MEFLSSYVTSNNVAFLVHFVMLPIPNSTQNVLFIHPDLCSLMPLEDCLIAMTLFMFFSREIKTYITYTKRCLLTVAARPGPTGACAPVERAVLQWQR